VKGKELDVGGQNFMLLIYPSLGETEKGAGQHDLDIAKLLHHTS
jgi:hypothetical protein